MLTITTADIAEWEDLCDLDPITESDIQALFGPDAKPELAAE
jgi:hypothetical protein